MESGALLGVTVPAHRQMHGEREDVRGPHTQVDGTQPLERAQQQARADQKDEGEGDLADDQDVARAGLAAAAAAASPRFAQHRFEVRPRRLNCRSDAERNARHNRDTKTECQDRLLERSRCRRARRRRALPPTAPR